MLLIPTIFDNFNSLKNSNNIFLVIPIYLDFLVCSSNNLVKYIWCSEERIKTEWKKIFSSSGDERVQSGMHIEKWFITFQGDWFQKILHVCLLLIYRKTDSENFKWRDIGLPLLWYFKVREVVADMSYPIVHSSGCYCYGKWW